MQIRHLPRALAEFGLTCCSLHVHGLGCVEALWDDSVYAHVLFWNDNGKPRDWIELHQHKK